MLRRRLRLVGSCQLQYNVIYTFWYNTKVRGQGGSKKPSTQHEDAIWHQECSKSALQSPLTENSRDGNSNSLTTICLIKLGCILRQPSLTIQSILTDNGDAWFHKTITEALIIMRSPNLSKFFKHPLLSFPMFISFASFLVHLNVHPSA